MTLPAPRTHIFARTANPPYMDRGSNRSIDERSTLTAMQDFLVLIRTIVAALTIMFFLWSKGKGAQQAAAQTHTHRQKMEFPKQNNFSIFAFALSTALY
jgi:hypothetical protein